MSLAHQPITRQRALTGARWRVMLIALAAAASVVIAMLLLVLSPAMAGWIVLGGAVVVAVLIVPVLALYLIPFAVAFGSLISLSILHFNVGPTDLLVGALALAWLLRRVLTFVLGAQVPLYISETAETHAVPTLLWRPADALSALRRAWAVDRPRVLLFAGLLIYLLVVMLSIVVALSKAATLKEVVKWSEVTALVALALWCLRDLRQVRWLAWAMIGAGVAQALLGYAQWVVASGDLGPGGASIRVFGTFAQPNPYSGYLNLSLPIALALVLFARDARERWVAGAASVILLGAQALADSRGGLIGLAAALVVLVVVGWRRERLAAIVAAIGMPLALIAWFAHIIPAHIENAVLRQVRLNDVSVNGAVNNANFSTMERLEHWLAGLRMFAAHPFLGVGAGNYNAAYARFAPNLKDWPEPLGHAHNYYINAAAETGTIGLLAFLALVCAMFYVGWCATRGNRQSAPLATDTPDHGGGQMTSLDAGAPGRGGSRLKPSAGGVSRIPALALAIGFFAVVVALTVHNFTDDLFVHAMELQLALCLGCLLYLLREQSRGRGGRTAYVEDA